LVVRLNREAVNNIVDPLKAETTSSTDPQIKKVFNGLFNLIEVLASENEKITAENQQLKNKIHVLKGEQGKPDVKPNNRNKKNISSEKERKDDQTESKGEDDKDSEAQNPKKRKRNRKPKLPDINIDREGKCEIDQSILPPDAINKGPTYTNYIPDQRLERR
jgi:hypothetical protein